MLNNQSDNLLMIETQLKEFINLTHQLDTVIASIKYKKQNHVTPTDSDYYNYISTSIDVVEYVFGIGKLFDQHIFNDDYIKIARTVNDIYKNIYTQQYTQAMINTIDVLKDVSALVGDENKTLLLMRADSLLKLVNDTTNIGKKSFKDLDQTDLKDILTLIDRHKGDTLIVNLLNQVAASYNFKQSKFVDIVTDIAKYGMFIANVVSAQTPNDVESIIESAVLPVGSSSIKKNSNFNISLQGYLGAFALLQKSNAATGTWNDKFGVFAPIGVSFSYGLEKGGSISVFTSLFDIGAIVDYQLRQDSIPTNGTTTTPAIKKDYTVKLGQIISPGCYLVYGLFGNIPLSIGIGGQYGPGLGKIESNGNTIINNPAWRWNAFLCVDIPFVTFKNNVKKGK
jgi:hypothetical protein